MQMTASQCVAAHHIPALWHRPTCSGRVGQAISIEEGGCGPHLYKHAHVPTTSKTYPKLHSLHILHGHFSFILCLSYRTQALAADIDCTNQKGHVLRLADHNIASHIHDSNPQCLKHSIPPFKHLHNLSKDDGQRAISPTSLLKKASLSEWNSRALNGTISLINSVTQMSFIPSEMMSRSYTRWSIWDNALMC